MIKRAKTAKAVPPQRGLLPRLRNVRIRSKLGLILIIPIIALIGLAVVRLADAGQSVIRAQDSMRYAEVAQYAAELGEQLQTERSLAAMFLGGHPSTRDASGAAYRKQFDLTDERVEEYIAARDELTAVSGNLRQLLERIDVELEQLDDLRDAVEDRNKITLSSAIFGYRIVIADLLAYRESLPNIASDADAADLARGSAALGVYTEYVSEEQVTGALLLTSGELTPAEQEAFLATLSGQTESLRAFNNAVEDRHVADLQRMVAGKGVGKDAEHQLEGRLEDKTSAELQVAIQDARRFETDVRRATPGGSVRLTGGASPQQWFDSMAVRVALTREMEEQLDEEFRASLQAQHDALVRSIVAEVVTILVVLVFAALIALVIARSMAQSLRRLREGALAVAYESLPQSVARLRNPETLGEMSPDQVAASVKDPVQVRGRDEIGQVSQAFNVVHREAVRIAAEQAALRANVATMFVNLARRSQVLVDRLIGHLDRLERGEEDPDRLAELFQLDHLATRMRRNDENLLVLAGADSTRVQREPAPLSDALRAAQSEVEQYTRIEFGIVDLDVEVAPHAVNDIVHLLAELLDNATSFSPPDTVVVVDARRAGDRAILQIEDRGLGISAEQLAELNTRLASPPLVDVAVSRMMGLVVVGRLATRHGIRVELRAARDRGTIADVILPAGVLILPQRGGRQHTLGLPQARSPLALESSADALPPQGWQQPQQAASWTPPDSAGWDPSPGGERSPGWDPAAGWEQPGPWGQSGAGPTGPRGRAGPPMPDRRDLGGAVADGLPTSNGARDLHLPQRRPGEGIDANGQPTPMRSHAPGGPEGPPAEPAAPHGAPHDVRGRRPAAEPAPRIEQPGSARSRESIHSAEMPMEHPPAEPAGGRAGQGQQVGSGLSASPTFGITGTSSGGFPLVGPGAGNRSRGNAERSDAGPPPGAAVPRQAPAPRSGAGAPAPGAAARPAAATSGTSSGDPSLIPPNVDDTMELPIFREVESAWFRTKQPSRPAQAGSAGHGGAVMPEGGKTTQAATSAGAPPRPDALPRRNGASKEPATRQAPPSPQPSPSPRPAAAQESAGWRTAADDGWRAASAAAESAGTGTTESGLPKRTPMAQLVPGGVDTSASAARNRSPDAVRGLLSAYHRGVQRGRQSSARTSSDEGPGKEQA